ncbi:MAG TPA: SH3 domain-containing protein [Candidatus Acidoferrum sp.]|nr:SH3 domain-containing protein [Candidatus Acidoferrum sp.]
MLSRPVFHAAIVSILAFGLLPCTSHAQGAGQVACARPGDYTYLYSSMTTLDVITTLECGQEVIITGRYDSYFGVRTAKGEVGYVPATALLLLKTTPGEKIVLPPTKASKREKTPYDEPSRTVDRPSNFAIPKADFILRDSTPVTMKLTKALTSSTAHVGDIVNLQVSTDVVVDGLLVIRKGATALGVVNEAEPKRALGRGGKLGILLRSVRMADDEDAVLRSGDDETGSTTKSGVIIPVMRGKDITFPEGMEFVGFVNGDARLKRENFHEAAASSTTAPAAQASSNPHL